MSLKFSFLLFILLNKSIQDSCKTSILSAYNLASFNESNADEFLDLCPSLE